MGVLQELNQAVGKISTQQPKATLSTTPTPVLPSQQPKSSLTLPKTIFPSLSTLTPKSKKDLFKQLDKVSEQLNAQFKTTNSLTRFTAQAKRNVPCTPTGI